MSEIEARIAIQKLSSELDGEDLDGCDWQLGYDEVLKMARSIAASWRERGEALNEIAAWDGRTMKALDAKMRARAALSDSPAPSVDPVEEERAACEKIARATVKNSCLTYSHGQSYWKAATEIADAIAARRKGQPQ
jgi:leucyl aminopeptidase (aminopeptidase T)